MTKPDFAEWLQNEIDAKGWSQAELARQSKLSPSQLTRLFKGERGIGEKGVVAIANALKIPVDLVFEKAGLLPPKTELSPLKRKLMELANAREIPETDIQLLIDILESRMKHYKENPQSKTAK